MLVFYDCFVCACSSKRLLSSCKVGLSILVISKRNKCQETPPNSLASVKKHKPNGLVAKMKPDLARSNDDLSHFLFPLSQTKSKKNLKFETLSTQANYSENVVKERQGKSDMFVDNFSPKEMMKQKHIESSFKAKGGSKTM